MSSQMPVTMVDLAKLGIESLRKNWGWFVALGVLLIVLGTVAIGSAVTMTIVSVLLLGWLMVIAGGFEVANAFYQKAWSGFFIDLLAGLLYVVVGFLFISNPKEAALTLTLFLAILLLLDGLFRIVIAVAIRFPHWPWLLLHGVVSLALGLMIWRRWPFDGLWVIGLFIGIDMIFNGWSLVMLGLAARSLPKSAAP